MKAYRKNEVKIGREKGMKTNIGTETNERNLSSDKFYEEYMRTNQPVIISNLATDWRATKSLVISSNLINLKRVSF